MDIFLMIFFTILGIVGLIYKVDAGVFVGLSLVPWELIKIGINQTLNLIVIIICGILGSIFFIMIDAWILLVLFIFIQLYNGWGFHRKYIFNKKLDK